jgi:hypothetical protein
MNRKQGHERGPNSEENRPLGYTFKGILGCQCYGIVKVR